jgi:hypothetical protein
LIASEIGYDKTQPFVANVNCGAGPGAGVGLVDLSRAALCRFRPAGWPGESGPLEIGECSVHGWLGQARIASQLRPRGRSSGKETVKQDPLVHRP